MSIGLQKNFDLLPIDQLFDREEPFMSLLEAQLVIVQAVQHDAAELGMANNGLDLLHVVLAAVVVV